MQFVANLALLQLRAFWGTLLAEICWRGAQKHFGGPGLKGSTFKGLRCLMQIIDVGPTKSRLQFSAQPQSERLPRTQTGTFRDSAQAILEIALTWPHPKLTKCCSNGALHI